MAAAKVSHLDTTAAVAGVEVARLQVVPPVVAERWGKGTMADVVGRITIERLMAKKYLAAAAAVAAQVARALHPMFPVLMMSLSLVENMARAVTESPV